MLTIAISAAERKACSQGPEAGHNAGLPPGLDPARSPIIAEHFFGWRPVAVVAAQIVQDLKYRRKVKHLVAKGDRVVGEMLAELAAGRNLGTVVDQLLDRYLDIDDATLDATNGRHFPPPPLTEVR